MCVKSGMHGPLIKVPKLGDQRALCLQLHLTSNFLAKLPVTGMEGPYPSRIARSQEAENICRELRDLAKLTRRDSHVYNSLHFSGGLLT
jgi:hypothetical protein